MSSPRPWTATFRSLAEHRNYRFYFGGQIVSYSGTFVQDTALPWVMLQLTHSPIRVGLLVTCRYLPYTLFGLSGGVVADRVDNRRVLIATQSSMMCVALALTVLTLSGNIQSWELYAAAFCGGIALVFDSPSKHAFVYQLVGRRELPNALALNNTLQNSARVVGPAIGGVLIAAVGVGWCFAVNAMSFVAVLGALLLIRPAAFFKLARSETPPRALEALREGYAYFRESREFQLIVGTVIVLGFFAYNPMRTLIAVLAGKTLHGGPQTYGVLFGTYGAGAVAGGLFAATLARAGFRWLALAAVSFSCAVCILAPLHNAVLAGVLLFVIGGSWALWATQAQSIIQLAAPDHLRGRVVGIYVYALLAGAPLGAIVGGWLAEVGGTELAFGVGGGASLAASFLMIVALQRTRAARVRDIPLAQAVDEPVV